MNSLIEDSYRIAETKEEELLETFREFFRAPNLVRTKRFNVFDYIDKEQRILIELKSRTNAREKYPTTVIGLNKIKAGQKKRLEGYRVYLVFSFTDGVYYTELDDSPLTIKEGGRFDRGRPELKQQVHYDVLTLLGPVQSISDTHTALEFEQTGPLPDYSTL